MTTVVASPSVSLQRPLQLSLIARMMMLLMVTLSVLMMRAHVVLLRVSVPSSSHRSHWLYDTVDTPATRATKRLCAPSVCVSRR